MDQLIPQFDETMSFHLMTAPYALFPFYDSALCFIWLAATSRFYFSNPLVPFVPPSNSRKWIKFSSTADWGCVCLGLMRQMSHAAPLSDPNSAPRTWESLPIRPREVSQKTLFTLIRRRYKLYELVADRLSAGAIFAIKSTMHEIYKRQWLNAEFSRDFHLSSKQSVRRFWDVST